MDDEPSRGRRAMDDDTRRSRRSRDGFTDSLRLRHFVCVAFVRVTARARARTSYRPRRSSPPPLRRGSASRGSRRAATASSLTVPRRRRDWREAWRGRRRRHPADGAPAPPPGSPLSEKETRARPRRRDAEGRRMKALVPLALAARTGTGEWQPRVARPDSPVSHRPVSHRPVSHRPPPSAASVPPPSPPSSSAAPGGDGVGPFAGPGSSFDPTTARFPPAKACTTIPAGLTANA